MADRRIAEGRRVLVVEDEMIIALLIEDTLIDLGAVVVGPASHVEAAVKLAAEAPIDAAVLDVNIRGGNSNSVADVLSERGIPFVFCSGYSEWALEERHQDRPRLTKPYSSKELETIMLELFGAPQ